ncbi:type III pantothenate kinase [Marinomonas sp.]|nr:type III pantothenate kinase [Marinomonas sp.]MDB4837111.1 type III pantothenate kinase [Marinomonas sp.]
MFAAINVLVVDAGNTSVKYTAFENGGITGSEREMNAFKEARFAPEVIYFASVRSLEDDEGLCADLVAMYPDISLIKLKTEAVACGVVNAYFEPERLGVDRWLSIIAAHHEIKGDVVVVDVGTAIKIDVVSTEGRHLGGYIAPGFSLMEQSLLSSTAKVRYLTCEVEGGGGLPNSTARAVTEGCYEMIFGFVERIYRKYSHFNWVVTGGDSMLLLDALDIPMKHHSSLVACGAVLVGDELLRGGQ